MTVVASGSTPHATGAAWGCSGGRVLDATRTILCWWMSFFLPFRCPLSQNCSMSFHMPCLCYDHSHVWNRISMLSEELHYIPWCVLAPIFRSVVDNLFGERAATFVRIVETAFL